MLSEISQTQKDRYCMVSLIFGIYKKHENKKQSQTHRVEEWLPGSGELGGG